MIRGKSITMKKTITMMSEEFENENTGEKVEGITTTYFLFKRKRI